jgi:hypothetical protein
MAASRGARACAAPGSRPPWRCPVVCDLPHGGVGADRARPDRNAHERRDVLRPLGGRRRPGRRRPAVHGRQAGQHRRHVGQPGTSQQVEHERRSEDGDRRRCGGHVADRHDRSPSAPSKGTQRPRPRPAGSTGRRTPFRGRNARVHAPGKWPDRTAALGRRRGRGLSDQKSYERHLVVGFVDARSTTAQWTFQATPSASLLVKCALARPEESPGQNRNPDPPRPGGCRKPSRQLTRQRVRHLGPSAARCEATARSPATWPAGGSPCGSRRPPLARVARRRVRQRSHRTA